MSDQYTIEKLIKVLEKVPEKNLRLIDLINELTIDGEIDVDLLGEREGEINLAIAEAKMYGSHTIIAVNSLQQLEAKPDV
ncbi:hypothetical protein LCGC14_1149330 [marine sediment metagenome]|uniref:Uncharacterized protein n=1 Tax=marine sediment metagenome TaxID=412755 RepID=A0A0F9Q1P1_9ZZZZ|nr:hypothetical protein [Candidatus Aminicenantes bacterium]